MPGKAGRFQINGRDVSEPRKLTMQADDVVLLETPGGGGFGSPD
jgi:N-methylhydantoinase B/oxoprolinase/acetone carboxylase alpha subunit